MRPGRGRNTALATLACIVGAAVLSWREIVVEYHRWKLTSDLSRLSEMALAPEGSILNRAVRRFLKSEKGRSALLDAFLNPILNTRRDFGQKQSLRKALSAELHLEDSGIRVTWTDSVLGGRLWLPFSRFKGASQKEVSLLLWRLLTSFPGQGVSSTVLPELRFTILEGKEEPPVRPGAKAGVLHGRREVTRPIMEIRRDLQNGDREVRFLAFHDVASLGDRGVAAIPELVKALKDKSRGVPQRAQGALRRLGALALPALLDLIHDEDPEVFWTAAHLIADSEGMMVPAIPRLMQLLEDEQPRVRGRAAQAIGRIGIAAREAVPRLRKALSDSDLVVRRHAENALEKIIEERRRGE